MKLSELFQFAQTLMQQHNLSNEASSQTSGFENIGHTVPWSYEAHTGEATECLAGGTPEQIAEFISRKRISINRFADLEIMPDMAFTVEPQISSDSAPTCSFHMIVAFINGEKIVRPHFSELFEMFDMTEYMATGFEPLEKMG